MRSGSRLARVAGALLLMLLAFPLVAAAAEAGEASSNLPKIFNFTILATILVLALRKPLAGYLSARAEQIREQLATARADREEAERAQEVAAQRSSNTDAEVEAVRKRIADSAVEEGRRIVAAAEEQAREISAAAKSEIEAEVRAAERRLAAGAARSAVRLARTRLETNMTDEDHERLVRAGITAIRSN